MAAVSWPGFPPQSRVIPAVIVALLAIAWLPLEAVAMIGAWGTALVATLVKALMRRPRPVAGVDVRVIAAPLGGSSFPSGHTITYVGVYGFLAYLAHTLLRPTWLRRLVDGAVRRRSSPSWARAGCTRATIGSRTCPPRTSWASAICSR